MLTPPDLKGVYNPSFDVTPAELITAIVTEKVCLFCQHCAKNYLDVLSF
jgi:methylthioribose-1-phosphate isomerase